jgi:hypothetical protein
VVQRCLPGPETVVTHPQTGPIHLITPYWTKRLLTHLSNFPATAAGRHLGSLEASPDLFDVGCSLDAPYLSMDRPHVEGMDSAIVTDLSSWIKPRPSIAKTVTSLVGLP